jgi:hypothetical protein
MIHEFEANSFVACPPKPWRRKVKLARAVLGNLFEEALTRAAAKLLAIRKVSANSIKLKSKIQKYKEGNQK